MNNKNNKEIIKKTPSKKPSEYNIGDLVSGAEIDYIIGRDSGIIIFLDKEEKIGFEYDPDVINSDMVNLSIPFLSSYSMRIITVLPKKFVKSAKVSLGHAFFYSVHSGKEDKTNFFQDIDSYIELKAKESAHIYFVLSSLIFNSFLIFMTWFIVSYISRNNELNIIILSGLMGSLGAMISILIRSSEIILNSYTAKYHIYFQGIVKILIGYIFGCVCIIAIKANIIMGIAENNFFYLMIMALISGFSERLIPDILKNYTLKSQNFPKPNIE